MTTFANQADMQRTAIEEIGDRGLALDGGALAHFSSAPLNEPSSGRTEAVIVVHGALRNAGDYFRAVETAGKAAHRVIIAPQFLTDVDVDGHANRSRLLSWGTEDWKGGLGRISSFTVMDHLLTTLGHIFPDLERVTMVGNSAGGQFVNRYAAVGHGPERLGVPVRFVVANPSTYLYFDRQRPTPHGFAVTRNLEEDRWRYGFSGELPGYVQRSSREYFEQYIRRDVVYLLGEEDSDPDAMLLEVHPAALAQGRARRQRGERYHAYLAHKAGRPVHRLEYVEGVGHDASAMFMSSAGRACLFDDHPAQI